LEAFLHENRHWRYLSFLESPSLAHSPQPSALIKMDFTEDQIKSVIDQVTLQAESLSEEDTTLDVILKIAAPLFASLVKSKENAELVALKAKLAWIQRLLA